MAIQSPESDQKSEQFISHLRQLSRAYRLVCEQAAAIHAEHWDESRYATLLEAAGISRHTFNHYAQVGRAIPARTWNAYPNLFYTYFRVAASAPNRFAPSRPESRPNYWLAYAVKHQLRSDTLQQRMNDRSHGLPEPGDIPHTRQQRERMTKYYSSQGERAMRRVLKSIDRLNTTYAPYLHAEGTLSLTPYTPRPSTHLSNAPEWSS